MASKAKSSHRTKTRTSMSSGQFQRLTKYVVTPTQEEMNHLVTLFNQRRYTEGEAIARQQIERFPLNGFFWKVLGATLAIQGRIVESIEALQKTVALIPMDAEAHNNLGITLKDLGRLNEAEASCRRALEIKPDYAVAHSNLGITLKDLGRLNEAETSCRRALEIKPDYEKAHNNLGITLKDLGRLNEAEASCRRALEIKPDYEKAHSNLLFTICNIPNHHSSYYLEEAIRFGQMVTNKVSTRFSDWTCAPSPSKLKVGIVSGDLRNHPVGYFLEGILPKINSSSVELIAYSTNYNTDELTKRIKPHFSSWKSLVGLNDESAANLIYADAVHVLLDLSGHTAHNRLPVFAWKPAPVQATWLGYWASTGVAEINYILADETGVPIGQEGQFTEQLMYLPDTRMCFSPIKDAPPVSGLPVNDKANQGITFGCFQGLSKVNDKTLLLWARVLTALPSARVRWRCSEFDDPGVISKTAEHLSQLGISLSRVCMLGKVPRIEYLAAYSEIDIVLDTFPFPGGTTTCEALWMGVPTLTLSGDTMCSRQGASLLAAAGLTDWIVEDDDDYVAKAVEHTSDLNKLAALRARLREQVMASPLFDAARFARNLEDALWGMWERSEIYPRTHRITADRD